MTIIEKYYDDGSLTIQVDYTRSTVKNIDGDKFDLYESPFSDKKSLDQFLTSLNEPFKRLPDIRSFSSE